MALPGFVYGGLLASLADCHAMATAAAGMMLREGATPGRDPTPRFVTASLSVTFYRPTPLGPELVLRAKPVDVTDRRVTVEIIISADNVETVHARVVAVKLPPSMVGAGSAGTVAARPPS
jgi:acyl-coenzyme A thioesterase PaaI-like protein